MAYKGHKDFAIAKIQNMMNMKEVYKFFDKKSEGGAIKSKCMLNQQLAEELHKSVIRKFKKRKVYSPFENDVWGTTLAKRQLKCKYNSGIRFLLCVINIYYQYTWVGFLKEKKVLQ